MMKTAIVMTTIHIPHLLEGYANNFRKYGHKNIEFIVVGDLKTPTSVEKVIKNIRQTGFEAEYLDITKQRKWMQQFPVLEQMIPYNSDNRRNIGYLTAVERGADTIISIDDDNYVKEEDYLAGHQIVGTNQTLRTAESSNHWFNICSMLETEPKRTIYPRGFPYSKRWKDDAHFTTSTGRVVINAGLWLSDPDVDAITNLSMPVKTIAINSEQVMLAPKTFATINTQNTAFHRDVLPCYYYIVMEKQINGHFFNRYGDIWSGLFARRIVDQVGDRITFGHPLAEHRRNTHDLLKDFRDELWGVILTDEIVPVIESLHLTKRTYSEAYVELAEGLEAAIHSSDKHSNDIKAYFSLITENIKTWVDVCTKVMK